MDYTGADVDTLYEIVSQDIPVVVWVTISMTDRGEKRKAGIHVQENMWTGVHMITELF